MWTVSTPLNIIFTSPQEVLLYWSRCRPWRVGINASSSHLIVCLNYNLIELNSNPWDIIVFIIVLSYTMLFKRSGSKRTDFRSIPSTWQSPLTGLSPTSVWGLTWPPWPLRRTPRRPPICWVLSNGGQWRGRGLTRQTWLAAAALVGVWLPGHWLAGSLGPSSLRDLEQSCSSRHWSFSLNRHLLEEEMWCRGLPWFTCLK